jgi:phenylacetate-coenzyme A ligase PaaK-like adenylate-forming protein
MARSLLARVARPAVNLAFRRRYALLAAKQRLYSAQPTPAEVARYQIDRFNDVWASAVRRFAFYAEWKKRHGLPARIASLSELSSFPVLHKTDVQENERSILADAGRCGLAVTGGSTGEPARFPADANDLDVQYANMYLGRSWWGIRPLDPIVMIWGHAHLFAGGISGWAKWTQRRMRDALIGSIRLNAYTLNASTVAGYYATLCRHPGASIVSYASAFGKLLDHLEDTGADGRRPRVKNVILTAESVLPTDLERTRRHFGVEPIIEYGMAETGAIAYSRRATDALHFFWDSFHVRLTPAREIVLSTLWERRFPLVNYASGDIAAVDREADPDCLVQCRSILGRVYDTVDVPTEHGAPQPCHGNLFLAILGEVRGVRAFRVEQAGARVTLFLRLGSGADLERVRHEFLDRLEREIPDVAVAAFRFEHMGEEPQTIAGKRRLVARSTPAEVGDRRRAEPRRASAAASANCRTEVREYR